MQASVEAPTITTTKNTKIKKWGNELGNKPTNMIWIFLQNASDILPAEHGAQIATP